MSQSAVRGHEFEYYQDRCDGAVE